MKRLFTAVALLALSSATFAATLVPVPLLNPVGSTAGQAIVSSGPTTAPAWGAVALTGISAIAANTVLGNATASSASPTAVTVTGCNGAAQALQWTNGSGFGCNSVIATSGANSNITGLSGLTSPVSLPGVTNGSAAAAGTVGETFTSTVSAASGVSLTTAVVASVTSIPLTAGDWDVLGSVQLSCNASTVLTNVIGGASTASNAFGTQFVSAPGVTPSVNTTTAYSIPGVVINVSTPTTVFLLANAQFTTSTCKAGGTITARRRH